MVNGCQLAPGDDLSHAELRQGKKHEVMHLGNRGAEEDRREDHVDEKARRLLHRRTELSGHGLARRAHHGKSHESADDGRRQIETLQERQIDAQDLADDQHQAQRDEN